MPFVSYGVPGFGCSAERRVGSRPWANGRRRREEVRVRSGCGRAAAARATSSRAPSPPPGRARLAAVLAATGRCSRHRWRGHASRPRLGGSGSAGMRQASSLPYGGLTSTWLRARSMSWRAWCGAPVKRRRQASPRRAGHAVRSSSRRVPSSRCVAIAQPRCRQRSRRADRMTAKGSSLLALMLAVGHDFTDALAASTAGRRDRAPGQVSRCEARCCWAQGVHPNVVSDMLGHTTVANTLDTYSHVTPTMHREAARVMEQYSLDNCFRTRRQNARRLRSCT